MDQFFHQFRRGEGETGGADLGAEVLGVKGLVLRHGQQVEIGLLAVAEEKVFADADAQRVRNGGAGLHGLGRLVLHPAVRDVELVQQGEALQNLFRALGGGGGVNFRNGHHQPSVSLSSFSPAR